LVNPKETKDLSEDFELLPEKGSLLEKMDEDTLKKSQLTKLCDLCRKPVKVSIQKYMEKRE
jgi:hypothetical protein